MKYFIFVILLFNVLIISAQENNQSVGKFFSAVEYGYNYTYKNYGAAQVLCRFTTKTNLSIDYGMKAATANIYSITAVYGYEVQQAVNAYELQLSIFATYTLNFAELSGLKLKLHVGPTLGLGLSAKETAKTRILDDGTWGEWHTETPYNLYKKETGAPFTPAKRFEIGLAYGASLIYKGFSLGVSYDMGLSNILNFPDSTPANYIRNNALKTNTLSINVGYSF